MAQVDNLDALDVQVEFLGELLDHLVVAQQHGMADAFGLGLGSSLEHRGVYGLGEDYTLWMSGGGGVEFLRELGLLA